MTNYQYNDNDMACDLCENVYNSIKVWVQLTPRTHIWVK